MVSRYMTLSVQLTANPRRGFCMPWPAPRSSCRSVNRWKTIPGLSRRFGASSSLPWDYCLCWQRCLAGLWPGGPLPELAVSPAQPAGYQTAAVWMNAYRWAAMMTKSINWPAPSIRCWIGSGSLVAGIREMSDNIAHWTTNFTHSSCYCTT